MRFLLSASFAVLFAVMTPCDDASAGDNSDTQKEQPVYMEADKLGYDRKKAAVVARGNVEIMQGEYILLADEVIYYQKENLVKAKGNISLMKPDGNVIFADNMELKDDLKTGIVKEFRIRMSDNSIFAAREAQRVDENRIKLRHAVYSPCKICSTYEKNKDKGEDEKTEEAPKPLWQLKARKVKIDEEEQRIKYRDLWFEIYGVPIAYTPYFSHPTPNADNKSGFLTPTYEGSSQLGTGIKLPYYWSIAKNKDLTISPHFTSEEGLILEGEYRHLTDKGEFRFNGSITNPTERDALGNELSGRKMRGHIDASGNSAITDNWRWGFDIHRSSDDTYLRRYGYSLENTLTSQIYAERIKERNYTIIRGLAFQGLEANDDPDKSPLILPSIETHIESKPLWRGIRASLNTSALLLSRNVGADTRRLSLTGRVKAPYTTDSGHIFELDSSIRTDVYQVERTALGGVKISDDSAVRTIPQLAVKWRYPLIKQMKSSSILLEPTAQIVTSSNGNNPSIIQNEDSLLTEFSDSNLLDIDRYAGIDMVENGTRAVYAMRAQWQFSDSSSTIGNSKYISGLIGQQFQLTGDNDFPNSTSGASDSSDYVGRVSIDYKPINLSYRFRVDDNWNVRRNAIRASYNLHPLNVGVDYLRVNEDVLLNSKEEAALHGSLAIGKNWSLTASGQRDIKDNRAINAVGGIIFHNECLTIVTNYSRNYIRDRDVKPENKISLLVTFKNLN